MNVLILSLQEMSIENSFVTGETRKKELDSTGMSNLAGTGLCGGHNLPGLIGIGLTNQSVCLNMMSRSPYIFIRYVPAVLCLYLTWGLSQITFALRGG